MIEFKYKPWIRKLPSGEEVCIYRPNAVVTLINGDIQLTHNMLVDSGADVSLIPKSVGDGLGLEIHEEEQVGAIGGIGGQIPIIYRNIKLKIGEWTIESKIGWTLLDGLPLILGREDVFDKFHIEFLQDSLTVRFKNV